MTKCPDCDGTGMNALGDLPCLACNGRGTSEPCERFMVEHPTHAHDLALRRCVRCGWRYNEHPGNGYYEVADSAGREGLSD